MYLNFILLHNLPRKNNTHMTEVLIIKIAFDMEL